MFGAAYVKMVLEIIIEVVQVFVVKAYFATEIW